MNKLICKFKIYQELGTIPTMNLVAREIEHSQKDVQRLSAPKFPEKLQNKIQKQ